MIFPPSHPAQQGMARLYSLCAFESIQICVDCTKNALYAGKKGDIKDNKGVATPSKTNRTHFELEKKEQIR